VSVIRSIPEEERVARILRGLPYYTKEERYKFAETRKSIVLEGLNRRNLLNWLRMTYKFNGRYCPSHPGGPSYSADEIKEELNKRPPEMPKLHKKRLRHLMNTRKATEEEILGVKKFRRFISTGSMEKKVSNG
jgi:hypothetical protein